MAFAVQVAEFLSGVRSAGAAKGYPWPEFAIVGRSNVGKSSFINRITMRKKLAHSSSTPGSTREVNFFRIQIRFGEKDTNLVLADLPGFGFAKFSKSERELTEQMIVEYVESRQDLRAICLLNDSRRSPEKAEIAIRDLAAAHSIPVLVVATKIDKLNKSERAKAVKEMAKGYGLLAEDIVVTGEGTPPEEFWGRVFAAVS